MRSYNWDWNLGRSALHWSNLLSHHSVQFFSMILTLSNPMMLRFADCATVTNSLTLLRSAASQLQSIITQRFNEAVSADDLASIERFFKLFPLLSMHDSGLEKFSAFLCSKVKQQNLHRLYM